MATKKEKEKKARKVASARDVAKATGGGKRALKVINLPGHIGQWKFDRTGLFKIDIVPYEASKGDKSGKEGFLVPYLAYEAHEIGPDNERWCCPERMANKPCPVCKFQRKLKVDPHASEDRIKALYPRKRRIYLFRDRDDKERRLFAYETGVKKSFGEVIDQAMEFGGEDENFDNFHDPEEGYWLSINVVEDTFNGNKYNKPALVQFQKRTKPMPDDLLDKAPSMTDLLVIPSYEELEQMFLEGIGEDEATVDTAANGKAATKKRTSKEEDDDEDDDDDTDAADDDEDDDDDTEGGFKLGQTVHHPKFGECTVTKVKPNGKLNIADEEEDVHENVDPSDLKGGPADDDDDDDDDATPLAKKRAAAKAKKKPVDDDEDEDDDTDADDDDSDDDDDDDEPVKKPAAKGGKGKAPVDDDDDDDSDDDDESDADDDDDEEPLTDDDDDDDDAPPAKKKPAPKKTTPPPTKKGGKKK